MLKFIDHTKMGKGEHGWLESHFHFSFAQYYNPKNINFGVLRVLNDDIVQPNGGFAPHPHKDMEIISYVVNGTLSHKDSMGNERSLTRGQVQYMSAGTGVIHSEYNHGNTEVRFLQMWILPNQVGHTPNYGDYAFKLEDRYNKWLPLATDKENKENDAPIKIHADVNVYATILSANQATEIILKPNRQAYLVCIEGHAIVGNLNLRMRDAVEITEETLVPIKAKEDGAHLYLIEMAEI